MCVPIEGPGVLLVRRAHAAASMRRTCRPMTASFSRISTGWETSPCEAVERATTAQIRVVSSAFAEA
eukprot:SAG31_NODE_43158_length_268_cov_0.615385_1_plen_66_part_10